MPGTTDEIYRGGNPLAPTDNILSALRAAHDAKRREASERWAAFETARRKAIESGTDLKKDHAALRRLDDLHKEYKAVAEDLGELTLGVLLLGLCFL